MTAAAGEAPFVSSGVCWICGADGMRPVASAIFELSAYAEQDPALAAYSGASVALVRCGGCGFAQPASLPALDDYFGRMYDQRWSDAWLEGEFRSTDKDLIFRTLLDALEARVPADGRTLLDLGAHVGRFVQTAAARGWRAEGVELNPRTAAYAARATGLPVHRQDLRELRDAGRRYGAVTLVDVLEHVPRPVQALAAVAEVVAPGGWVAVKVPHGPAQLVKERIRGRIRPGYRPTVADNLVHVSHFTPQALRIALTSSGYTDVAVRVAAPELPAGASAVARAFRRAAWAAARALPGGASTPLAMNLVAFARRPG